MKKKNIILAVGVAAAVVVIAVLADYQMRGWNAQQPEAGGGSTATTTAPEYRNDEYRFTFALPADWAGYSIVTSTWRGTYNCGNGLPCPAAMGPEILIRNPNWTTSTPWQDIPIMIFTHAEWNAVASETLAVSAAPIPPSVLGSSTAYVFALPARYNYAFPNGWQEVQQIIESNPLSAF